MNKNVHKFLIALIVIMLIASIFTLSACTKDPKPLSAYDIAVENGFEGTEQEWLQSLVGENGAAVDKGYSAYEVAVQNGFDGTELEWLESLKGESGDKGETNVSSAVNSAILSIVSITSQFSRDVYTYNRFGQITGISEQSYTSAGSGVIISMDKENGDAYIVTNHHVVYDVEAKVNISQNIKIYLYGMELEKYAISAQYIGSSMSYDIAVLKISGSDIIKSSNAKAATIGTSDSTAIGDSVIAIGNPNAAGISVTSGIISKESEFITMTAADNSTQLTYRVMRIDAAVNGGNSGGGLFNDSGELIGIVNAKVVSESIEGIAYAIPIDLARAAYTNILNNCDGTNTSIMRCFLGITVETTDLKTVVSDEGKVYIKQTITINEVESGSIAATAGLKVGDVIESIRFEGKLIEIDASYKLTDYSLLFSKGDVVEINVLRNGESKTFQLTMGDPVKML